MFLGMGSGLLVCLAAVQRGDMTVGDTVLFMGLMTQLYQPLAFFGSNYRWVPMGGWFQLPVGAHGQLISGTGGWF